MRTVALVLASFCALLPWSALQAQKDCSNTSTGLVPLIDLVGGSYNGWAGGLYDDTNVAPQSHTDQGVVASGTITPIDGKICFMSIGVSNTREKSTHFLNVTLPTLSVDPAVVFVNGAINNHDVSRTASPTDNVWNLIDTQLSLAGCTADQVQALWVSHGKRIPPDGNYTAFDFQDELRSTVINAAGRFVNLKQILFSSRVYAGYGERGMPEPYSYESAFGVKWLILDQIAGTDAEISLASGFPWMDWIAYPWADGLVARSDGLIWECDDFRDDGIHPCNENCGVDGGSTKKVSDLLAAGLTTHPATAWFRGDGSPPPPPPPPPPPEIELTVVAQERNGTQRLTLTWTGATGSDVEVWIDGGLFLVTANDESEVINTSGLGASVTVQICELGGAVCSDEEVASF